MSEQPPEVPEDDDDIAHLSFSLPGIIAGGDQLAANLLELAKATNAVYGKLLEGGFSDVRAQKMAQELWGHLIIPDSDGCEPAFGEGEQ